LPGLDATSIATGIKDILKQIENGNEDAIRISRSAEDWRKEFGYSSAGERLSNIVTALLNRLP
jgi:hypothetical protein